MFRCDLIDIRNLKPLPGTHIKVLLIDFYFLALFWSTNFITSIVILSMLHSYISDEF